MHGFVRILGFLSLLCVLAETFEQANFVQKGNLVLNLDLDGEQDDENKENNEEVKNKEAFQSFFRLNPVVKIYIAAQQFAYNLTFPKRPFLPILCPPPDKR